jgi:hypothetical protein
MRKADLSRTPANPPRLKREIKERRDRGGKGPESLQSQLLLKNWNYKPQTTNPWDEFTRSICYL